ncbi:MAG TPA: hypothetical protein VN767_25145 [Streptosporangiaceae bacterium]|jgi:hypothetical protein|nr:hypothetical protein [Streptosporangiaceae bacterium]
MGLLTRSLAQVLADSDAAPPDARCFFYDEARLRVSARGRDQVLYRAERDACPARAVVAADGSDFTWRLDRVTYPGVDLPTGELGRSVGHWNPPGQWEIFEVLQGEIVVLTTLGPGPVELVRCRPGSAVCLLPGTWHLTYVLSGPAIVANIYTEPVRRAAGKYFSAPTVRVGLRWDAGKIATFAAQPSPAIVWRQAPSTQDVAGGQATLEELLTSPTVNGILKDPQFHYQERVPAWPDGAGVPIKEW